MAGHPEDATAVNSREAWTPEQQLKELTRRLEIMRSNMDPEVTSNFKAEPNDMILAIPPKNGATMVAPYLPPNQNAGKGSHV